MPSTRRQFLHSLACATGGLLALPAEAQWLHAALGRPPLPQRTLRIGHVIQDSADVRSSAALGVRFGLEEAQHAARLFGVSIELVSDDDAERLVSQSRPQVLIGGTSEESCDSLGAIADAHGVLFFNVACGSDALRGTGCRRNTFHIAASEAMQRDALALAGVSSAEADVVLWDGSLERYGAGQLNPRFHERFSTNMDSDAWAGWLAVKIAAETCFRAKSCSAQELRDGLERTATRFDGHKGRPLSFRAWDHQLRQPLYVIGRADRSREIVEVPDRGGPGMSAADQLDRLGATAATSGCKWEKR